MNENAVLKELLNVYCRKSTTPGVSPLVVEPVMPITIDRLTSPSILSIEHHRS